MSNESINSIGADFEIWYKSKSESFLYINERSRVPSKWLSYSHGIKEYSDSIIKPINMYASRLSVKPKLLDINNNIVKLQQTNHAEIFLLNKEDGLYNIDRPWIRQYYLSNKEPIKSDECFDGVFRFYMPWVIDEDVVVSIEQSENSPFLIHEQSINFKNIPHSTLKIEPPFIHFQFKKKGDHMIDDVFAKISRLSPMYNIVFKANDIIIERVRKFYDNN